MDDPKDVGTPKFNPLSAVEDYFLPATDGQFRNKPSVSSSSNEEDVAYFKRNLMRVLKIPEESVNGPSASITREVIALSTNRNAKRFDASRQSGPRPSDFGDHEAISEEAVTMETIGSSTEKEKP